jgi:hypothetical protein
VICSVLQDSLQYKRQVAAPYATFYSSHSAWHVVWIMKTTLNRLSACCSKLLPSNLTYKAAHLGNSQSKRNANIRSGYSANCSALGFIKLNRSNLKCLWQIQNRQIGRSDTSRVLEHSHTLFCNKQKPKQSPYLLRTAPDLLGC